MRADTERAVALLKSENATCVLCKGDMVYTSDARGIAPMMRFLSEQTDLQGFCAADKIVGKAAAMLFALAGVTEVYAEVMSEAGAETLSRFGVAPLYVTLTPAIINRRGDGPCPMEQAVCAIDTPEAAYEAISATLQKLHPEAPF